MNDNSGQDEEEKDDLMSWTNFSSFLNEGDNTSKYLDDSSSSHYSNNNNMTNNNIILTSTSLSINSSSNSSSGGAMPFNNGFYNNNNNNANNEEQLQPSTNLLTFPISMEQLQQLKQKEQPPPQKITLKSIEQLKLQLQQNNQIQFEAQPIQKHTFQYQSKNIKNNNNNNNNSNNNGAEEEQQQKNNLEKPLPSPPSLSSPPPLPKIPTLGKDLVVKLKQMNLPFSKSSVYKITSVPKTNGTGFKNKYDPVSIAELTKSENFNYVPNNNNNDDNCTSIRIDSSTSLSSPFPVKVEFNEILSMDTSNSGYLQNQEEHVDLITSDITESNYNNNNNNYYYSDTTYGQEQVMDVGQTNSIYQENLEFDEICKKIGRKLLESGKVYCPHCFDVFDHQIQLASHEILGCNNNNSTSYQSDVVHHVDQGQRSYSPIVAKPKSFATKTTNANVMPKIVSTSSKNIDILSLAKSRHKIPSTLSIVPTKATQPKVKVTPPSKPVVTIQPKIQPKIQAKIQPKIQAKIQPKILPKGTVQPKGIVQTIVPRTSLRGPRGPYRKRENTRIQLRTRKNRNVHGGFYICPFFPCPEKFSNKEIFHGHLRDSHLPVFAPGQPIICPLCPSNPDPTSFTLIYDWVSHISGLHSGHKKILPGPAIKYRKRDRRRHQKQQQIQVKQISTPVIDIDPLGLDGITNLQSATSMPPTTIQLNRNITLTAIPSQPIQHPQQHQQSQQLQHRQQQQQLQQQRIQQLQNRHRQQQQQQIASKTIQIKVPNTFKGGRQQKKKKKNTRDVTHRRLFSCPFTPCPNNFFGSSKLFDSHLKNFHAKGKPYACTLCPMEKEFTTIFDWIIHIKTSHVQEQKFQNKTSSASAGSGSMNINTNNTNSGRIPALIPISRPGLVITEKY